MPTPPLTFDDDENVHEVTDSIDWRESYYVNFFDTESDLNGLAWQGVRPNAGVGEAAFVLYDGDKPLIRSVSFHIPVAKDIGPERAALGNQEFVCVEPWKNWQIRFDDGTDRAVVDWKQLSGNCDWDWEGTNSKHFQTAGRVDVEAVVDGRTIRFSGFGERDRAWGPRNYSGTTFTWWQTVQFPDAVAAHVFTSKVPGGSHDNHRLMGYLHQDGETFPLASFTASEVVYGDHAGGPPVGGKLELVDTKGRALSIAKIEPLHQLNFVSDGAQVEDREPEPGENVTLMHFTFDRFVRSDGSVGRGMIDCPREPGERPERFRAVEPCYSHLHNYGLDGS